MKAFIQDLKVITGAALVGAVLASAFAGLYVFVDVVSSEILLRVNEVKNG